MHTHFSFSIPMVTRNKFSERTWTNETCKSGIFHDPSIVIIMRVIYVAYAILYIAYAGAYISAPDDPMFFYALGSRISRSWMMVALCTLAEVLCLTSATSSCLFATYSGLSYVFSMRSLLE